MGSSLTSAVRREFHKQCITRGEYLYRIGGVQIQQAGTLGIHGRVDGQSQSNYKVFLDFTEIVDGELGTYCQCPRFETSVCKHVWAMILACGEFDLPFTIDDELFTFELDPEFFEVGKPLQRRNQATAKTTAKTENNGKRRATTKLPRWQQQLQAVSQVGHSEISNCLPTFHREVATEQQYWFVLGLSDFAGNQKLTIRTYCSKKKKDGQFGKPQLHAVRENELSDRKDPSESTALSLLFRQDQNRDHYRSYYYSQSSSEFNLAPKFIVPSLEALSDTGRFAWTMDAAQYLDDPKMISYDAGPEWTLEIDIQPNIGDDGKERILVTPTLTRSTPTGETQVVNMSDVVGVSQDGILLRCEKIGTIHPNHVALARAFQQAGTIQVPKRNLPSLMEQIQVWQAAKINLHPDLPVNFVEAAPKPKLHLSSPQINEQRLRADVIMKYDRYEIDVLSSENLIWDTSNKTLLRRDFATEETLMSQLPADAFHQFSYESHVSLNRSKLPQIVAHLNQHDWEIVADGNVMRKAGSFNISVESGQDWFDVHATADFDGQIVSLPELLKAQRKGSQYIVLDDGSHGILPEQWLAKFGDLEKAGSVDEDSIRFTATQALLLDAMLEEQENVSLDEAFKAWCEKLNSFSGIAPATPPKDFRGNLREYQQLGLGWLNFLNEYRLGGCLADDMGLGKTIQVLSLLEQRRTRQLSEKETRLPSLIVVPKSLIFNWLEEAAKFTPNLKVVSYHGTDRATIRNTINSYDAIVTTYGTLRNDAAHLREQPFDYVILDEAQAIKNPNSVSAKACRLMQAENRLAMTGTPVENHLGDLWSLFDFLNPGMLGHALGSASTITNTDQEERLGQIAKALRPFILRRTKQQVLTELPEKTEQTLYCDMEPKQKKLYNELRDHYRQLITGKVKELGLAKSKMHVLEALLRLRQTACDPRLVNRNCGVKGAKLDLVVEQLEELTAEGHKTLVFSQFTSLLSLLRKELDAKKWDYEYLDGKTRKRNEVVKRFQESDECGIFLISLKAGGHGLNLTAADYVFILDPWWNPAVEAQAIDRAHRMGQTKSVNAYRMICRDTVEEKIIELQASKRKLADAIITQKQSLISELTSDDLRLLFE